MFVLAQYLERVRWVIIRASARAKAEDNVSGTCHFTFYGLF